MKNTGWNLSWVQRFSDIFWLIYKPHFFLSFCISLFHSSWTKQYKSAPDFTNIGLWFGAQYYSEGGDISQTGHKNKPRIASYDKMLILLLTVFFTNKTQHKPDLKHISNWFQHITFITSGQLQNSGWG